MQPSAGPAKRLVRRLQLQRWRAWRKRVNTPLLQLAAAVGVMVGGASLIGAWMVGVVLIVGGLLVAGDALLREVPAARPKVVTHEDVLERYRQAR